MMTIFMFALLVCGVFGDDVSVMEGDSVTLHTKFTDTQRDEIKWWFGPEGSSDFLVNIDGITPDITNDERFKDRLQILDIQNGDLIIKNMRKNHAGLYRVEIDRATGTFEKKVNVIVYDAPGEIDAGTDEVRSMSKTVGDSVTLNTDVSLQKDALILWRFGHKGVLIAKDYMEDNKTPEYPDGLDGRFKGRLQVNNQTGDLTIRYLTYKDSGVYKLKMTNNNQIIHKTLSLSVSVSGDEVKSVSVMEGDSVTLNTDITEIQRDEILWRFGPEGASILLVNIDGITPDTTNDERFKDRLQISDIQNGDLIIKNMRKNHAGLYRAEIGGATGTVRKFNVSVYDAPDEIDCDTGEVKSVSETVRDSVTLNTGVNLQRDALILWRFGHKNVLIAKDEMEDNKTLEYPDERFRDRLQVNDQTGDLTITNIRTEDSGDYKLKISSSKQIIHKTFSLSVKGGGWSSGGIAGLCVFFLLVIAGIAVSVFMYLRKKQTAPVTGKIVVVTEGDRLILPAGGSKLQPGTRIEWKFNGRVIMTGVMTNDNGITENNSDDPQFTGRLKWNRFIGDLIVNATSTEDAGLYEVNITYNEETSHKRFKVNVTDGLISAYEGDTVILHAAKSKLQTGTEIEWTLNGHKIITGKMTEDTGITEIERDDQQFKNRLELDNHVGYLVINNISNEDTGLYEVKITYNKQLLRFKCQVNVIGTASFDRLLDN